MILVKSIASCPQFTAEQHGHKAILTQLEDNVYTLSVYSAQTKKWITFTELFNRESGMHQVEQQLKFLTAYSPAGRPDQVNH